MKLEIRDLCPETPWFDVVGRQIRVNNSSVVVLTPPAPRPGPLNSQLTAQTSLNSFPDKAEKKKLTQFHPFPGKQ